MNPAWTQPGLGYRKAAAFLTQKLVTARFFAANILPEVHGLVGPATSGKADLEAAVF